MSKYTQQQRALDARDAAEIDLDNHERSTVHDMADWIAEHKRLESAYKAAKQTTKVTR